jgi:deazaflavin-dependent oxidoreductase (nitroreductase family)
MTAQAAQTPRTPPRFLIRTFWIVHRAAFRVSGGRFGLQRPEAGGRFGMMKLSTVGRRSGQRRSTIIGYYEDGPNLVTLAMNGWGTTEPAWWLNLQASPDTVVRLANGPRAVRARAARGAERDRLWARFREFPGWGDDIDGLAARRPTETAVVVFEPRPTEGGCVPAAPDVSDIAREQRADLVPGAATSQSARG